MSISIEKINLILQEEDIEGFIEMGAPNDEYLSEAEEIASLISSMEANQLTENNVISGVIKIWQKYFGLLSDSDINKRMAGFRNVTRKIFRLEEENY